MVPLQNIQKPDGIIRMRPIVERQRRYVLSRRHMRDRTEKRLPGGTEQSLKEGAAIPVEGAFPPGEVRMKNRSFSFDFGHQQIPSRHEDTKHQESRPVRLDGPGISSSPSTVRAAIQGATT